VVLILGRFTDERKAVLDALREELRKRNYLPILFDVEKPRSLSTDENNTRGLIGFDWQGTTYASLSAIARAITGTAWSGPRFFALAPRSGRSTRGNKRSATIEDPADNPEQFLDRQNHSTTLQFCLKQLLHLTNRKHLTVPDCYCESRILIVLQRDLLRKHDVAPRETSLRSKAPGGHLCAALIKLAAATHSYAGPLGERRRFSSKPETTH
jgi:hypothetical protein